MWCRATGSGEIAQGTLNDFVELAGDTYRGELLPLLSSTLTLVTAEAVLFSTDTDDLHATAAIDDTGSVSGNPMPAQVSVGITWSIASSYRGGHPRTYLPGIAYATMDGVTTIQAAEASVFASHASSFHTALEEFTGTNWASTEHGVVSFVRNGEWRTPPVFIRITGARVDQRIDTQRRRLGRDLP